VNVLGAPADFNNQTGASIICGYSHPAHTAGFHPGSNDEFSIYQFTTPPTGAGNYTLNTTFGGLDVGGTDVHILDNGTQIFGGNITGGSSLTDNRNLSLAAGDTIDFAVGFGPDDNFFSDGTSINATLTSGVSAVPEPSTLLLLATSLTSLGLIRRRGR
jgi:hypothetical protein